MESNDEGDDEEDDTGEVKEEEVASDDEEEEESEDEIDDEDVDSEEEEDSEENEEAEEGNKKIQHKIVNIFLSIIFSICFGCSKEPSHWDGSFEYPQHIFWLRNKIVRKVKVTLV